MARSSTWRLSRESQSISDNASFAELLKQVRAGDEQAATELFRSYEEQIRRIVRVRLTDPGLRRQFDSIDVCQSVMADFYIRASLGQFELDSADQLVKLLAKMARNKLVNKIRYEKAGQRDIRRLEAQDVNELVGKKGDATPSQIVAHRDLLEKFRSSLSSQDRYIAQQRNAGKSWNELALELGGNSDALRVRFRRAIDRVSQELGLESLYHD